MLTKERTMRLVVCCVWTAAALWLPVTASLDLSTASHCLKDSAGGQWTVQTTITFNTPTHSPKGEEDTCANNQPNVIKNVTTVKEDEPTVESADESGYVRYEGVGSYKLHRQGTQWSVAKTRCEQEDAYLAIINSRDEERIIRKIIIEYIDAYDFVFLGFNDLETEGEFRTVNGDPLTSVGYVNWASGEPNNYNSQEDCGAVVDSGQLNDVDCNMPAWFLCERPL